MGTRVPSASGTRTASPCPPSPFIGNMPPLTQALVKPYRQWGQVPSLKVYGATTRSPSRMSVTSPPTSSTTPRNSWQIGPADARERNAHDGVGPLGDGRVRTISNLDRVGSFEESCAHPRLLNIVDP